MNAAMSDAPSAPTAKSVERRSVPPRQRYVAQPPRVDPGTRPGEGADGVRHDRERYEGAGPPSPRSREGEEQRAHAEHEADRHRQQADALGREPVVGVPEADDQYREQRGDERAAADRKSVV